VEMGVTAELGRCRMTVRELLSITPGALIDLDRPAGAPVDVLVNGTLIARGEVVVIDEEFGIRISELGSQPVATPEVLAASRPNRPAGAAVRTHARRGRPSGCTISESTSAGGPS